MCGRFVGSYKVDQLVTEFADADVPLSIRDSASIASEDRRHESYNVAPTQLVRCVAHDVGGLGVTEMRWGFTSRGSRDGRAPSLVINARSETVLQKPLFREPVRGRRCVVPMNGFYEWKVGARGSKIPFYLSREDGRLLLAAAIWEPGEGGAMSRFCILTRESTADMSEVHHRSPVHLTPEQAVRWTVEEHPPIHLCSLDHPPPLRFITVSTRVNSTRNNDETLLKPVPPPSEGGEQLSLF